MNDILKNLKKLSDGKISESEIKPTLAPGCELKKKTKKKTTFEAGVGAVHWKKKCSKIENCDDSNNNTDWVCGDWQKTDDY